MVINLPSIDVRTVVLLMVISNLLTAGLLIIHDAGQPRGHGHLRYIWAKLAQSCAFLLIGLRDYIPAVASVELGNTLLFIGVALEASALSLLFTGSTRLDRMLGLIVGGGAVLLWLVAASMHLRVACVSAVLMALILAALWSIRRATEAFKLRPVIGVFFALLALTLAVRAVLALVWADDHQTLPSGAIESLLFVPTFMYLMFGVVLFLTLANEQANRLLQQALGTLREREALLNSVFDTSSAGIFVLDASGCFTLVNKRMGEMMRAQHLVGQPYLNYLDPALTAAARANRRTLLESATPEVSAQRLYVRSDGSRFWGHVTGARLHDGWRDRAVIGVIVDISELKAAEQRIRELAQHDALTGLANRALFSDRLHQAIVVAQRERQRFALAYLDLDRFKAVNDAHGHAVGDLLLQEVARRISACVRESDTVARMGGDEYVVVLRSIETDGDALLVAEKIRAALRQDMVLQGHTLQVSCSIGLAIYPDHGADEAALSRCADAAMYRAKAGGRDKVELG